METKAISPETKSNLELLGSSGLIKKFYLAGGTACALYYGHRISYDLDFFTREKFDSRKLERALRKLGKLSVDVIEEDTFLGQLNKIKISFFYYQYPLISKTIDFQAISIAGIQDLAAMKVDALQGRGTKKDFIDLYTILSIEKWLIDKALDCFRKKYKEANYNLGHILKSLVYFEDANSVQDKLTLITDYDWDEVKSFFVDQVKKYQSEIIK